MLRLLDSWGDVLKGVHWGCWGSHFWDLDMDGDGKEKQGGHESICIGLV